MPLKALTITLPMAITTLGISGDTSIGEGDLRVQSNLFITILGI